MKKNLFLLFSFYFFVLQSVFVGLLRGEPKFYWLALINCAFICLIAIFAKDNNSSDIDNQKGRDYREHDNTKNTSDGMNISHLWIFVISFLFGVLVVFRLKDIVLYLRVLCGIVGAFFVFMVGGVLFNYKSLRVWEGKFYLILLVLALMWSIVKLLGIDFSAFKFESKENLEQLVEDNTFVDEKELVGENLEITGNVELGENTGDIKNSTGVEQEKLDDLGEFEDDVDLDTLATFSDVIKFLLKDEKLSTKTDLSFSYIGKSNPDYAYYKTAYEKKMIGKDLQPTKNLMCETYVVMKGLAEGWNIGNYVASEIKQAYWAYAKNHGLLPSCQYGKYVKISDLK